MEVIPIAREQQRTPAPIYKEQSDALKQAAISADIDSKVILLQAAVDRGKTDLNDIERVKSVCYAYMESCKERGGLPTVMGLSASLGISRQWLNEYMRQHPHTDTTRFLEQVKEVYADCLTQAALYRHISESVSIFILKNTASMADKLELEAKPTTGPMGEDMDATELAKRIEGSIPADFDYDVEE